MSASEIKYVYTEWESKGQAKLLPYALQYNYEEIDSLLKDMDNIAQDAGLGGIGYRSQESDIAKLAEWAGYLNAYINSVIPELQESLDKPLYIAFNHHATENLSRIRMEDYTTENKLGIKRRYTVSGIEGMPPQELVKDTKLSMEDFLGLTALEETGEGTIIGMPKAFRDFTDMFAVDYNLLKDELKTQDGKEVTLEDYLLSLKSAGEFSHKMDKPVLEFISAVLDVTAVKPLIECCTGYDMITGEDLSDFERGMKAVSGLVSLFTLGQGSIVMNGGKLALSESVKLGAKILAVDAVSTGVAYGTSEICQAMGCPGGLTLVLSMLAGMGSSAGLGSKVFGNGGVNVSGERTGYDYLDDQLGSLKNKVKINKYDSAESVNSWWNEQGYTNPPYSEKTVVQDLTLTQDYTFVRVYDGVNTSLKGGWVMHAEDIKELNPKEIQIKYALPHEPVYVGEVNLKTGDNIRLGEVAPNFGFKGGGIQIDLKQQYIGEFKEIGKISEWR